MATKRTAKLPYRWSNGTYHSRPENKPAKKKPPAATYKPAAPSYGGKLVPAKPALKPIAAKPAAPVQPLDPDVVNQQVIAQRNIGVGDLFANYQQGQLDQQYGYGAGGASNPYSEAAKLQKNFERSQMGAASSFASAGQFNSGAYGSAQNENTRNYAMGQDANRRAYDQASGGLQFDRLQRYADAGTGVDASKFNALLKALGGL